MADTRLVALGVVALLVVSLFILVHPQGQPQPEIVSSCPANQFPANETALGAFQCELVSWAHLNGGIANLQSNPFTFKELGTTVFQVSISVTDFNQAIQIWKNIVTDTTPVLALRNGNGEIDFGRGGSDTSLSASLYLANPSTMIIQPIPASSAMDFYVVPTNSGAGGVGGQFAVYQTSDLTNYVRGLLEADSSQISLYETKAGTGTLVPFTFVMQSTEAFRINTDATTLFSTVLEILSGNSISWQTNGGGQGSELIRVSDNTLGLTQIPSNTAQAFYVYPSGSSTVSQFQLFRTSDVSTNFEKLSIDTQGSANAFELNVRNGGSGSLRALQIWMQNSLAAQFNTDATTSFYGGGNTILFKVSTSGLANTQGFQSIIGQSLTALSTSTTISLPVTEPDTSYAVICALDYQSTFSVTSKTTTNFVLSYASSASTQHADCIVIHQ